jgi:hypothetical protein
LVAYEALCLAAAGAFAVGLDKLDAFTTSASAMGAVFEMCDLDGLEGSKGSGNSGKDTVARVPSMPFHEACDIP